jgi:hypothetical protein
MHEIPIIEKFFEGRNEKFLKELRSTNPPKGDFIRIDFNEFKKNLKSQSDKAKEENKPVKKKTNKNEKEIQDNSRKISNEDPVKDKKYVIYLLFRKESLLLIKVKLIAKKKLKS